MGLFALRWGASPAALGTCSLGFKEEKTLVSPTKKKVEIPRRGDMVTWTFFVSSVF